MDGCGHPAGVKGDGVYSGKEVEILSCVTTIPLKKILGYNIDKALGVHWRLAC